MLLSITHLSTGFPNQRQPIYLHRGLNFELELGEMVCVLGPNGAGKSTFLRTLLGYLPMLEGEVRYGEKHLSELTIRELSKLVSVVLTEKIEDFYLTAYEVVATGRYPYGTLTGKLTARDNTLIHQAFDKVGVSWLADHNFYTLSDGEKQKVMIARAIAQDTPFIFLDEPVAFIDAPSRIGVMQLLKQLSDELKKGILMATHDLDSALEYADKLWLLGAEGKWKEGSPHEMVEGGSINDFFDQKNVSFNPAIGRFEWTKDKE